MKTKIFTSLFLLSFGIGLHAQMLPESPKEWEIQINFSKRKSTSEITPYVFFLKSSGELTYVIGKKADIEEKVLNIKKSKAGELYKVVNEILGKFKIQERDNSDQGYLKRLKKEGFSIFILVDISNQIIKFGDYLTNLEERPEYKKLIDLLDSELPEAKKIKIP